MHYGSVFASRDLFSTSEEAFNARGFLEHVPSLELRLPGLTRLTAGSSGDGSPSCSCALLLQLADERRHRDEAFFP